MLLELAFEALEECKRVGCSAGETSDDSTTRTQAAHLTSIRFDHCLAEGDLAVTGDYDAVAFAY